MPTYYVGPGGNNGNTGLSWAQRKLTLNGAEDVPVIAGDTVYVAPGTYREMLTVDVSGAAGTPITYIGDYDGGHTDGIGGVVRITGSDNDIVAARVNCIVSNAKTYRTFISFSSDLSSGPLWTFTDVTNLIVDKCLFGIGTNSSGLRVEGANQANVTVRNCFFRVHGNQGGIVLTNAAAVDNAGHIIENCIFQTIYGIYSARVGGCTVRNSSFISNQYGIQILNALTVGQTVTVNNCIFQGCVRAVFGTVLGEIIENYNSFFGNNFDRTNVAVGANSNTYPPLFDTRWFFEAVRETDGRKPITPFDLSSASQLINVAGLNPTATDLRGTGTIGAAREWGALEYDPNLLAMVLAATGFTSPGLGHRRLTNRLNTER